MRGELLSYSGDLPATVEVSLHAAQRVRQRIGTVPDSIAPFLQAQYDARLVVSQDPHRADYLYVRCPSCLLIGTFVWKVVSDELRRVFLIVTVI